MSLAVIQTQISRFLSTDIPEVLAIRGPWGVGKTFAWNKYLREARDTGKIALKKYSYVSLFGLNSLDALRFAIFEQTTAKDLIGKPADLETLRSNLGGMVAQLGKKGFRFLSTTPILDGYGTAIETVSFLSVSGTLVCIDDFERKGKDLDAQDVMGLISVLKEQKRCKVVLILNEESLADAALLDYNKYREKVIDQELSFNPNPSECIAIALPQDAIGMKLRGFAESLAIGNIRILKKIERLARDLVPILSEFEHEVTDQALHALTLFGWAFYSKTPTTPPYDFIRKAGQTLWTLEENDEKLSDEQKSWQALLRAYGYQSTDEFDLQVAQAVEKGYADPEALRTAAWNLNAQIVASKGELSFRDAWRLFHDSFDANEEQVLKSLHNSFTKNTRYISPLNLDGTIRLFRELGKDALADELLELYIENRKDQKGLFDLDGYGFGDNIKDARLRARFAEVRLSLSEKKTVNTVLEAIAGRDSWGREDAELLSAATEDDFYEVFKNRRGKELSKYVDTCLRFGRAGNATAQEKKISDTAIAALKRIAAESKLNALRVRKYNVAP